MLTDKYIVNNVSFLHTQSEPETCNKCDILTVSLNNLDNLTYTYTDILQSININNLLDEDDLYVDSYELDEYDDNFFNLLVTIKSKSKRELLGLMSGFRDETSILYMDFERKGIVLSNDKNIVKKVKKAYPVYIQIEVQDERIQEEYIIHHNFYNGLLRMYKYDNKYFLHLTSSRHHYIITDLIMRNFGENILIAETKEEVLERFYNGFTKKWADNTI